MSDRSVWITETLINYKDPEAIAHKLIDHLEKHVGAQDAAIVRLEDGRPYAVTGFIRSPGSRQEWFQLPDVPLENGPRAMIYCDDGGVQIFDFSKAKLTANVDVEEGE